MTKKQKKVKWMSSEHWKLQKTWYKKLAESGFEDIETHWLGNKMYASSQYLTNPGAWFLQNQKRTGYTMGSSKQTYYDLAQDFLLHGTFASKKHKKLWELHVQGLTQRAISKNLRKRYKSKTKYSLFWVNTHIKAIAKNMFATPPSYEFQNKYNLPNPYQNTDPSDLIELLEQEEDFDVLDLES